MIKEDVERQHLAWHDEERPIVKKLEPDFEINWANRLKLQNANFSLYFISPLPHISQVFGFEQEVALAISTYGEMQARLIQALDQAFNALPAKGRVDQTVAIILSGAANAKSWTQNYTASNPQSRSYVSMSISELMKSDDQWFLRNSLMEQLFSRDLFDLTGTPRTLPRMAGSEFSRKS